MMYDVTIIGAGPAGTATSLFLSKERIPHLIIDKATFPRDKVCGDAISGKAVAVLIALDAGIIDEMSESTEKFTPSWGVTFAAPNGKYIDIPFASDLSKLKHAPGFIAKRMDFDDYLFSKLNDEFAEIRLGTEVREIKHVGNCVELTMLKNGREETIQSKLVVGAEGERSLVAKKLCGYKKELDHYCAGIRVYYDGVTDMHPQNFIELHFINKILPGYFWIFPLPNGQANVGLGMLSSEVSKRKPNLKKILEDIINNEDTIKDRFRNAKQVDDIAGWGLPLGSKKRPLSGDNFLLTGDAASLIDPFTGEGIGNSMLSGMVAARHIGKALKANQFDGRFLFAYDNEVYDKLWEELSLSRKLQKLVHYPWLFNFVVNKARKSKTLRETIICMFEDMDLRSRLKNPVFYLKMALNR